MPAGEALRRYPPPSNHGGNAALERNIMKTDGNYDWLAVTYPTDTSLFAAFPEAIARIPFEGRGEGPHGYKAMRVSEIGAIVLTDGSKAQGLHAILTGEALSEARILGVTDQQLANNVRLHHGSVSRLDLAVDIFDSNLSIGNLARQYVEGNCRTLARGAAGVVSYVSEEQTLYLGTRTSMRFFRAYNKGAQLKNGENHIRLELETKKAVASALNKQVAVSAQTRPIINRSILEFADFFTLPEYQQALADNNATLPRIPRKPTNTYKWLMDTVAPLLAKYHHTHPAMNIEQAFMTSYNLALGILREREEDEAFRDAQFFDLSLDPSVDKH